jgi:hypothetical protein
MLAERGAIFAIAVAANAICTSRVLRCRPRALSGAFDDWRSGITLARPCGRLEGEAMSKAMDGLAGGSTGLETGEGCVRGLVDEHRFGAEA